MQSSDTDNRLEVGAVDKMLTADIRQHLHRCERLLRYPALLERLPDKGSGIRQRYEIFTTELKRRETFSEATEPTATPSGPVDKQSEAQELSMLPEDTDAAQLHAIEQKYRDYRVPVEHHVRRMYGGSISEREIQRILEDVPPTYFMTFAETRAMEKAFAQRSRAEELQRLRQQVALGKLQQTSS